MCVIRLRFLQYFLIAENFFFLWPWRAWLTILYLLVVVLVITLALFIWLHLIIWHLTYVTIFKGLYTGYIFCNKVLNTTSFLFLTFMDINLMHLFYLNQFTTVIIFKAIVKTQFKAKKKKWKIYFRWNKVWQAKMFFTLWKIRTSYLGKG